MHLHFDCSSGIAGDMVLGALVDAGGDFDDLRRALTTLPVGGWSVEQAEVRRGGIAGTQVKVLLDAEQAADRHLPDIEKIIAQSALDPRAKEHATGAFRLLADAESKVHRIAPEHVHFHEVGAVDAIIDICGAMHLVTALGVEEFSSSPVNVGSGTVQCEHGTLPVPAPAAAELLRGVPIFSEGPPSEMATPTGVAILRALVKDFGPMPTIRLREIGNGAGTKEFPARANLLRVFLGDRGSTPLPVEARRLLILSAEIDDMTPELLAPVIDRGLAAGAVDVHLEPLHMKKGRAGWRVVALVPPDRRGALIELLFRETSTLGLKVQEVEGLCLARRFEEVETPYGAVQAKLALWGDEVLRVTPEFEDCRRLAKAASVPLPQVHTAALAAIHARFGDEHDPRT